MQKKNKTEHRQLENQNPIHSSREGDYRTRIYNGKDVPNNLGIASILEVVNKRSNQIGFVGTGEDTHNGEPGSVRTLMVHQDNVRKLTKAVVAEPGELTITVIDSEATENNGGNTVPLSTVSMRDDDKEIIVRNTYNGIGQGNTMRLSTDETTFEYVEGSDSRVFAFGNYGIRLYKNGQPVWGIDMNGDPLQ